MKQQTIATGALLDARIYRHEGVFPNPSMLSAHGHIALANDTLFAQGNVDVELTNYAVGWRDPANLEQELNFLFPPVQVNNRFSFRSWTNADEFLKDDLNTDLREIDGDFAFVEQYRSSETESRTFNKGLAIRIDKDRVGNQANWRERYTGRLRSRLLRCELSRGISLLQAAAVNTNVTWDRAPSNPGVVDTDPDLDVNDQKTSAADLSGLHPNSLYIGETAWNRRWGCYRAKNNAGGYASAGQTPEQVASTLGFQRTFKSMSRYTSSATARTQFLGDKVIGFLANDGLSEDDPSNTKNFWSPCENGSRFQVWTIEAPKYHVIIVEHYSRPTITSTLGIRQLTVGQ